MFVSIEDSIVFVKAKDLIRYKTLFSSVLVYENLFSDPSCEFKVYMLNLNYKC